NAALVLVLFVLLGAIIGGRRAGYLVAIVAAMSFDFLHTRPYGSLKIADGKDILTLVLLVAVGMIIGEIALRADRIRAVGTRLSGSPGQAVSSRSHWPTRSGSSSAGPPDRRVDHSGACVARRGREHDGGTDRAGDAVDVRNVRDVTPEVEHNGTVPVWWLIHPREMKSLTEGGYLELANEFEVPVGGEVYPHTHPTHEFYFVMNGRGVMTVGDDHRDVAPGDLVYIPPEAVHS